jgi:hypothetical protein
MVRTGARASVLLDALVSTGLHLLGSSDAPGRPTLAQLPATIAAEVLAMYRDLGGVKEAPTFRPGEWDLSFAGGLVVELDEELHFNRYRACTLGASWERNLPWTADYRRYCDEQEHLCVSAGCWGKRWTSSSTARMFLGGSVGNLDGDGAPRWKQRALYDSLKDTLPLLTAEVRLARVATHDSIEGETLATILDGVAPVNAGAVRELVDARTSDPTEDPERSD